MNGCCIKNTPMAVDLWNRNLYGDAHLFFLTHFHDDHMKGLTSSWRFPFYTSPVNKILLRNKFQFQGDIVISLELDEPHIIPLNESSSICVTLIDANHIPGSVMFLFQGYFGTILYCGDMRFEQSMLAHPSIQESLRSGGIDRLYLDNTYCCPAYNFPSQQDACQEVFNIIENHPQHDILLGVRGNIGKEYLFERIALKFEERILVSTVKFEQLKALGRPDVYTTDPKESRIEVIHINRMHLRNCEKWNESKKTISIKLSSLEFGIPDRPASSSKFGRFTVPYSDHSSWSELHCFVKGIRPREVIPIVRRNRNKKDPISKALESIDDMSVFTSYLSSPLKSISQSENVAKEANICIPVQNINLNFDCQKEIRPSLSSLPIKRKKMRTATTRKGIFYESLESSSDGEPSSRNETNEQIQLKTVNHPINAEENVNNEIDLCCEVVEQSTIEPITNLSKDCFNKSMRSTTSGICCDETSDEYIDISNVDPSFNYFSVNSQFRRDALLKASKEATAMLTELNKGQLPLEELKESCKSIQLYINTL